MPENIKIEFKRIGVENPDYNDIHTMAQFFEIACSLNKKDRKKMLKELSFTIDTINSMKLIDPKIKLSYWQWAND